MRSIVHRFAIAAATAACMLTTVPVAAIAQGAGTAANPAPDHPSVPPPLQLTDAQRKQIRASVGQENSDVNVAGKEAAASAKPAVGDKLPKGVTPHPLPQALIQELPVLREYKYVKFRDQILIVNSVTMEIVEMLPLS